MPRAGLCSRWGGRVLPLLLAYICYLLLGATIFQLLEKQAESQSRDRFQFEKLRFLENYTCLDQQAVEQFVQVKGRGWCGTGVGLGGDAECRSHPRSRAITDGRGPIWKPSVMGTEGQGRPRFRFWPPGSITGLL